jgi:hypothetical protein
VVAVVAVVAVSLALATITAVAVVADVPPGDAERFPAGQQLGTLQLELAR